MEGDIMSDEKKMIDETEEVSQEINNNETEPHKAEEKPAERNANDSQNSAKSANNSQNNAKNANNGAKSAKKPPIIPIVIGCVVVLLAVGAFLLIGGGFLGGSGDGGDGAPFGCLHIFTDWVVDLEPTCTEEGAKHKVCLGCKADLGSEVMPAKGHSGSKVSAVAPTCFSWGNDEYIKCTECGYSNYKKLDPTHSVTDGVCSICHRRVITSADELLNISLDGDYVLGCDITFEESVSKSIGDYDKPFTGSLDGNGYTIKGLVIYRQYGFIHQNDGVIKNIRLDEYQLEETLDNNTLIAGGLVGTNNGQIINCSVDGYVKSKDDVGGLVGLNRGVIDNCYSRGTLIGFGEVGGLVSVNKGIITNSYSVMDLEAKTSYSDYNCIGGFVAQNYGEIKGCYVECLIETDAYHNGYIAGFVGRNEALIASCYAKVEIDCADPYNDIYVAGFVGYNKDSIVNSYAIGSINFNKTRSNYSSNKDRIGGFVADSSSNLIENCYSDVDITANCVTTSYIGGFAASGIKNINNCFALGDITCNVVGTNAKYYIHGFLAGMESVSTGGESCYASSEQKITVLKNDVETDLSSKKNNTESESNLLSKSWLTNGYWKESGSWDFSGKYPEVNFAALTSDKPVEISTKDDLSKLSGAILVLNYVITNDISIDGTWSPIKMVVGSIDGKGHTISNATLDITGSSAGLIADNRGEIKNLNVKNFTASSSSLKEINLTLGILTAYNHGEIINCNTEGKVEFTFSENGSYSTCIGGLCGKNVLGNIYYSSADVDITVMSDDSRIKSDAHTIGGFVGQDCDDESEIKFCYAKGDIIAIGRGGKSVGGFAGRARDIYNCYSEGDVTVTTRNGTMKAGGFAGEVYDTQYCYCLGDLTVLIEKGKISAGGFAGMGANITYCYAYGDVDAKLADGNTISYYDYDVGGFIGLTNDKYVSSCYTRNNQVIKYYNKGFTNDYGTNEKHSTHMSASEILSVRFQTEIVHFPSDVWNIVEGKHPTLKPYME